jgi:hypothetical protein
MTAASDSAATGRRYAEATANRSLGDVDAAACLLRDHGGVEGGQVVTLAAADIEHLPSGAAECRRHRLSNRSIVTRSKESSARHKRIGRVAAYRRRCQPPTDQQVEIALARAIEAMTVHAPGGRIASQRQITLGTDERHHRRSALPVVQHFVE